MLFDCELSFVTILFCAIKHRESSKVTASTKLFCDEPRSCNKIYLASTKKKSLKSTIVSENYHVKGQVLEKAPKYLVCAGFEARKSNFRLDWTWESKP